MPLVLTDARAVMLAAVLCLSPAGALGEAADISGVYTSTSEMTVVTGSTFHSDGTVTPPPAGAAAWGPAFKLTERVELRGDGSLAYSAKGADSSADEGTGEWIASDRMLYYLMRHANGTIVLGAGRIVQRPDYTVILPAVGDSLTTATDSQLQRVDDAPAKGAEARVKPALAEIVAQIDASAFVGAATEAEFVAQGRAALQKGDVKALMQLTYLAPESATPDGKMTAYFYYRKLVLEGVDGLETLPLSKFLESRSEMNLTFASDSKSHGVILVEQATRTIGGRFPMKTWSPQFYGQVNGRWGFLQRVDR